MVANIEPAPVPVRRRAARRSEGRATVADVARVCGVSPMTVSRVVNGEAGVRGATRATVSAAILQLGYRPNVAARRLAGAAEARIALVQPVGADLCEALIGSVMAAGRAQAMLTVERHEPGLIDRLRHDSINGVVLPPPLCDDIALYAALETAGIAAVALAPAAPRAESAAVTTDDRAAAAAMTMHLAGLGHRRIGFIAGDPRRLDGYRTGLANAGLAFDPALVAAGDLTYRAGLAAAEVLLALRHPPSAIFTASDAMAAATISVAHRRRLRVPRDLSVAGFGDSPIAAAVWPALTTVRLPLAAMAEAAVVMLVDRLRRPAGAEHRQLPYTLVDRDSTGPFA